MRGMSLLAGGFSGQRGFGCKGGAFLQWVQGVCLHDHIQYVKGIFTRVLLLHPQQHPDVVESRRTLAAAPGQALERVAHRASSTVLPMSGSVNGVKRCRR
eukprot:3773897-Amphidinium_carterae.1